MSDKSNKTILVGNQKIATNQSVPAQVSVEELTKHIQRFLGALSSCRGELSSFKVLSAENGELCFKLYRLGDYDEHIFHLFNPSHYQNEYFWSDIEDLIRLKEEAAERERLKCNAITKAKSVLSKEELEVLGIK